MKTGVVIEQDLLKPIVSLSPIINRLLYQKTTIMIAADPGLGKSTVAIQLAASLTSATPAFGKLGIIAPHQVYYLSFETTYEDFLEQLAAMGDHVPLDASRIAWDDEAIGFDALKGEAISGLITKIQGWRIPTVIIIDPIYMAVSGGLSKDEPASAFVRFLNILKRQFGCAILLLHHTHRNKQTPDGKKESNPYYGSRWLEAHVDTLYIMEGLPKHTGVVLRCEKDRRKICLPRLTLDYHKSWMGCTLRESDEDDDTLAKLVAILEAGRAKGLCIPQRELAERLDTSPRHLRRLKGRPEILALVEILETPGKETLWATRG